MFKLAYFLIMSSNQNLSEMLAALAGAADSSPAAPGGTGSGGTSSPSTGSYVLIGDGGGRRGTGGGAGSLTADDGGVSGGGLGGIGGSGGYGSTAGGGGYGGGGVGGFGGTREYGTGRDGGPGGGLAGGQLGLDGGRGSGGGRSGPGVRGGTPGLGVDGLGVGLDGGVGGARGGGRGQWAEGAGGVVERAGAGGMEPGGGPGEAPLGRGGGPVGGLSAAALFGGRVGATWNALTGTSLGATGRGHAEEETVQFEDAGTGGSMREYGLRWGQSEEEHVARDRGGSDGERRKMRDLAGGGGGLLKKLTLAGGQEGGGAEVVMETPHAQGRNQPPVQGTTGIRTPSDSMKADWLLSLLDEVPGEGKDPKFGIILYRGAGCEGEIGSAGLMCIRGACEVKKHQDAKVPLPDEGCWLVEQKTGEAVFSHPRLSTAASGKIQGFADAVHDVWLTVEQWRKVFGIIEQAAKDGAGKDALLKTAVKTVVKGERGVEPAAATLEGLESGELEFLEGIRELAAEVYLLKCQVGTPEEGDAGFKNVFSGLGHLAVVAAGAGKKATAAQLSALEAHTLARACYQQICRMEAGPGPTANLSGLEAQIVAVGNRTGNLEGSLQQVLGQVNRILLGGPGAAGLITRVNALEAGGGALLGGMRGGHPPLPPPTAVAAATKELRKEIEDLKTTLSNETVKVGQLTFRSHADVLAFVTKVGVPNFHLFCMDVLSLTARMSTYILDLDDAYSQSEKLSKTKASPAEQAHHASFQFTYPPILAGKKADGSKTMDHVQPFHQIKKRNMWAGHGTTLGVRDVVSQNLDSVVSGIRGEIDMELRGDARALALDLLDRAVKDWERLVKAVDDTYQEACINATGDRGVVSPPKEVGEDCWELTLELLKAFCLALAKPRQAVQMASKVADPIRRSTHYLWATLRTVGTVDEWNAARFVKHPDFVPALMHHLYKQAATRRQLADGGKNVQKLEKLVADQSKAIEDLRTQLKNQDKEISTLKRKADTHAQSIGDLKRRAGAS